MGRERSHEKSSSRTVGQSRSGIDGSMTRSGRSSARATWMIGGPGYPSIPLALFGLALETFEGQDRAYRLGEAVTSLSTCVKDRPHSATVSALNRSVEYSNVTVMVSASGAITT